jgi:hypothetical protein
MRAFLILALFILPTSVLAFIASETDISQPYEIVPIEVTMPEQIAFLGTLNDFPVMYEIRSDEPFTFTAALAQPLKQESQPFSLLLVRRNDRGGGVTEVARQPFVSQDWSTVRDSLLGISFLQSPTLTEEVGPGTYRLEVSTPDNQGQYMFTVGTKQAEVGYFEQLGYIRQTQVYFGYGFFSMLKSAFVYYPLGIILLLLGIFQTWRFTRRQQVNA